MGGADYGANSLGLKTFDIISLLTLPLPTSTVFCGAIALEYPPSIGTRLMSSSPIMSPTLSPQTMSPSTAPTPTPTMAPTTGIQGNSLEDLTSSVYLYAGVFVCLLLFYEFGRTRVLQVYYPKTMGKYIRRLRIHAPDKPSKTLFSWPFKILSFMSQPDDCTIKYLGMDALMFLRFVWLCFKFFLTIAVPSLAILVPIFSSGVAEDAGGMDTYSMSNVVDGSNRLWAPVVAAYVFTYFFLGALTAEYLHFVQLRKTYVAQRIANSGPVNGTMIKQHSVMVENVPEKYRNDVALKAFFGKLFPGQVVNAVVVQEIGELEKLLERREVCLANLERCVARREGGIRINKANPSPRHRVGCMFSCTTVDSIAFYETQLEELNDLVEKSQAEHRDSAKEINEEEERALPAEATTSDEADLSGAGLSLPATRLAGSNSNLAGEMASGAKNVAKSITSNVAGTVTSVFHDAMKLEKTLEMLSTLKKSAGYSSTGFITFRSVKAAAAARQMLLEFGETSITGKFPPEPRDVKWKNCAMSEKQSKARKLVVDSALTGGILFWGGIVGSLASLSQLQVICEGLGYSDGTCKDLTDSYFGSLVSGLLPVVLLLGVISLLPTLFRMLAAYAGAKSTLDEQKLVLDYFFGYQIANIFLIIFSSGLADIVSDLRDDPNSVLDLLGDKIPKVAYYLATLVVVKTLGGLMVEVARPAPAVLIWLVRRLQDGKTLSMRELTSGFRAPPVLDYGEKYPDLLLVLLICLFYSCISPFILLFGLAYFFLAYIVYSNAFCYVYMPPFDAGGVLWYSVYRKCIMAIVIMQCTLAGVLGLKDGKNQAALLAPLVCVTLYRAQNVIAMYEKCSGQLSLAQAAEMDEEEDRRVREGEEDECSPGSFTGTEFVQPALHVGRAVPAPYRDADMVVDGVRYGDTRQGEGGELEDPLLPASPEPKEPKERQAWYGSV